MELLAWVGVLSVFIILIFAAVFAERGTRKSRSKSEDIAAVALLGVVMPQLMEENLEDGKEEN